MNTGKTFFAQISRAMMATAWCASCPAPHSIRSWRSQRVCATSKRACQRKRRSSTIWVSKRVHPAADRSGRRLWPGRGFGRQRLCAGFHDHRFVHVGVRLGPFPVTKSAVEMHTLLDLSGNIPSFIYISDGKLHDVQRFTC